MSRRLSRNEQSERNRALLLAAARRVFLARGYHAATLDEIAEKAGFSKGVVYSRFDSKADLFLALLEARIEERAAQHAGVLDDPAAPPGLAGLLERAAQGDRAEPEWQLLVIEFRVHAARDPELNRRYAAAHERSVHALAAVIAEVCARSGEQPSLPHRQLAEAGLAFSAGAALEQAADPRALQGPLLGQLATRLFSGAGVLAHHDAPGAS